MKCFRLKKIIIMMLIILVSSVPVYTNAATTVKLATPKSFKAWTDCCYEGYLKWVAVGGAKCYKVYRAESEKGKFKAIATVKKTSFIDKNLKEQKTYYYRVRAFSINNKSNYSVTRHITTTAHPNGNASCYNLSNVSFNGDSSLTDRTIFFLGSSVTYGSHSGGKSFADYLAKRNRTNIKKEAVSGTTIAINSDSSGASYVERIKKLYCKTQPDVFVCQLSFNDAKKGTELGSVLGPDGDTYDKATVGGAIDYITDYASKKWPDAQIVFYTISKNSNTKYVKMINLLYEAQSKWGKNKYNRNTIEIIDLWNNKDVSSVRGNDYVLYMDDVIHPTKAGYLLLWTPIFEKNLIEFMPVISELEEIEDTVESEEKPETNTIDNTLEENTDGANEITESRATE